MSKKNITAKQDNAQAAVAPAGRVLLTWVGSHDPAAVWPPKGRQEPGPILSLLRERHFDTVHLFLNLESKRDDFKARAKGVLLACKQYFPKTQVVEEPLEVVTVTDYRELYRLMNHACQKILKDEASTNPQYFVLLSPGTPQMQTVWVLLVQSGLLPAKMLITTPRDLVPDGVSVVRDVDLSLPDFPQVVGPGETSRLLGVLEAQNESLRRENLLLQAKVDTPTANGPRFADDVIPDGFRLRDYWASQERAFYARALAQAGNDAAAAARLLGLDPPAFRARAASLGLRSRLGHGGRPKRNLRDVSVDATSGSIVAGRKMERQSS